MIYTHNDSKLMIFQVITMGDYSSIYSKFGSCWQALVAESLQLLAACRVREMPSEAATGGMATNWKSPVECPFSELGT
jgi:hypothetical protein